MVRLGEVDRGRGGTILDKGEVVDSMIVEVGREGIGAR